jgi:type I restriction enzyme R subunit
VDGGMVEIMTHLVYELDEKGKQLRVVKHTDYTAEVIRTLYPTAANLREHWSQPDNRNEIMTLLADRGINFKELGEVTKQSNADPFDLLCHLAYNAPLLTRRERVQRLRKDKKDFFDKYAPEARAILEDLLEKYAEHGVAEFNIPEALKVPPISERGNVSEIIEFFGTADSLRQAVSDLQAQLYAA